MFTINNIQKVEFIEARYLRLMTIIPGIGVKLNMWRNFQSLKTVGLSSMSVTSRILKRNVLYDVKLTSLLVEPFTLGNRPLCYRITTVNGNEFLIGTDVSPFPITKTIDNFPSSVTDKSGTTFIVEYSSVLGILPILK